MRPKRPHATVDCALMNGDERKDGHADQQGDDFDPGMFTNDSHGSFLQEKMHSGALGLWLGGTPRSAESQFVSAIVAATSLCYPSDGTRDNTRQITRVKINYIICIR